MTLAHPLGMQLYSGRKFPPVETQLANDRASRVHQCRDLRSVLRRRVGDEAIARRARSQRQEWAFQRRDARGRRRTGGRCRATARRRDRRRALSDAGSIVRRRSKAGRRSERACSRSRRGFRPPGCASPGTITTSSSKQLADGSLPIEHLLGDRLLWEADLAWAVRGGVDPRQWIERYRGRIPLVHVKDIAPAGEKADEDGWADVGTGTCPGPNSGGSASRRAPR